MAHYELVARKHAFGFDVASVLFREKFLKLGQPFGPSSTVRVRPVTSIFVFILLFLVIR